MPEYMTISEVAQLLRSSERTVYEWLRAGRIQAYRAGGRWLVTREQVQHFLENDNRVGGGRFRPVAKPAAEVAAPAAGSQVLGLSGVSSLASGLPSPAPGSSPVAATGPKPNPLQNRKKNGRRH